MNPFFPESSLQFASPLLFFINLFIRNHMNTQYPMNPFFPNLPSNSHRHCFFWLTVSSEKPEENQISNEPFTSQPFLHFPSPLLFFIIKPRPFENQRETNYPTRHLLPNISFTSHRHYCLLTAFIWNQRKQHIPCTLYFPIFPSLHTSTTSS